MVPVRRRSAVGGCHRRPLTRGSPIIITPAKTTELPKRISYTFSSLRFGWIAGLVSCALFGVAGLGVQAQAQHASGGGTYFVEPGLRSEFQFNQAHVQCKIGHAVLADGTVFQMFMFSTSVDSVTVDSAAKTVVIAGTMVSIVNLRFPGDRHRVRQFATISVLDLLRRRLLGREAAAEVLR